MDSQQNSKIVTPIYFRTWKFAIAKSGIVELTSDEVVRVTLNEGTEKEKVILQAPLANVKRLRVFSSTVMRFNINGQLTWMDVRTGKLRESSAEQYQGSDAWIKYLRSKNMPVLDMTKKKILAVVAGISIGVTLLMQSVIWFL